MKVSILKTAHGGNNTWSNVDHFTPQDLADLWQNSSLVSPCLGEAGSKGAAKFLYADAVMVRISLAQLPLDIAMDADFTRKYATVAAHWTDDSAMGELLLAFELPSAETNAQKFVRLLAGLETLYAGSVRHSCAEEVFGLSRAARASVVLGNRLDAAAVRYLDKLGLEAKELAKGRGAYLRSNVTLDRSTAVTLPTGEVFTLQQLPKDVQVFCPVHVGPVATGTVHWYADGTPGVQCSHCKRTFAAPTTQRAYDFGLFDRTIKQLEAETGMGGAVNVAGQVASIRYLNSRYLPALNLVPGITFVKSPKGTGKTEALAALVAQCKKQRLRVLLLGHRRALIQSVSTRLGLDCYFTANDDTPRGDTYEAWLFEGEANELRHIPDPMSTCEGRAEQANYKHVEPTRNYAICLDSMIELDPSDKKHKYQVVIVDEAEQVFSHLIGDTLKGRRREVFARLVHYLKVATHVILLDADMNMITMTVAFEVFRPETPARFIINEPTSLQDEIRLYGDRGQLATLLVDHVGSGKKVFVATNSKRKAIDLSKMLSARHPETRVAVVTADNSQRKDVQDLLGDIAARFERDFDVLIASPAIGTGIDITFKDGDGRPRKVVDSVFGFFESNIVTHFDIDQQLMRVRHPHEVHVWIDPRKLNYETDAGCIKRELEKTVRRTSYLLGYEDDGRPVFSGDSGLVNIWAQVMAASRGSKNDLADLFRGLRTNGGWNLVEVDHDEGAAAFGKVVLAAARQSRQIERMNNLLEAEAISSDDAGSLQDRDRRGMSLTDAERHALERYKIENFYSDGEISPELIVFDNEGRTRQCVQRLECLISMPGWLENRDEFDSDEGVLAFDRRRYLARRQVLEAVFCAAGLFDAATSEFKSDVTVEAGTLTPFLQTVEANRMKIEVLFDMPLYEDCRRKPVFQLKGILGLVGLDLELMGTEQKKGKKTRRYGIPQAMLDRM